MTDSGTIGQCDRCQEAFSYRIIHNGFGDTAYAYCDSCGMVTLLSCWCNHIPKRVKLQVHRSITSDIEPFLQPCRCGGRFRSSASPRCPHCHAELSALAATKWIEENAPGTKEGWRWQRNWTETYSIIVEKQSVNDNWSEQRKS
jgi:hypothetical protein